MSIEKVGDKSVCLIFRNGAKVILHNSFILPRMSRTGLMSGRSDAIWIETGHMNEGKLERQLCKIQFHDDKAAAEAMKTVQGLI